MPASSKSYEELRAWILTPQPAKTSWLHQAAHVPKIKDLCGAHTTPGGLCQKNATSGALRCRLHGGRAGRPPGTPQHPNTRAAAVEGRRRYLEHMREAKAAGLIEKIPGGRRARGLPKLSKDKKIRKGQRILENLEKEMTARKAEKAAAVPAVVERPFEELEKAEQLSEATGKSLSRVYRFLLQEIDPAADPKMFALQINTALATISAQIRLDSAVLMARSGPVLNEDERERLDQAHRLWAMLAAEEAEKMKDEVDVVLPAAAAENERGRASGACPAECGVSRRIPGYCAVRYAGGARGRTRALRAEFPSVCASDMAGS